MEGYFSRSPPDDFQTSLKPLSKSHENENGTENQGSKADMNFESWTSRGENYFRTI